MPDRTARRLRLHLDADASNRSLLRALTDRGHDVTRTPADWMPLDASDELQLLGATAQGRCLFTFNVRDFAVLARRHPQHAGILLTHQADWDLSSLIQALAGLLAAAAEVRGRTLWLKDSGDSLGASIPQATRSPTQCLTATQRSRNLQANLAGVY